MEELQTENRDVQNDNWRLRIMVHALSPNPHPNPDPDPNPNPNPNPIQSPKTDPGAHVPQGQPEPVPRLPRRAKRGAIVQGVQPHSGGGGQ